MEFFGLWGERLGHSLSPEIHARIYELMSVPAAYKLMEIPKDRLGEAAAALRLLSLGGVNVTIPYKEAVLPFLDEIDPLALRLRAVNTVKNAGGILKGYNTDVYGFERMLAFHGLFAPGEEAVILGSGGAARGAAAALLRLGAGKVSMVSRSPRGKSPLPGVTLLGYGALEEASGGLLVNATPVGMWPHVEASPLPREAVARFSAVADTVYNPWETRLLALAKDLSKPRCNGLYMLVAQAAGAAELFLERTIPPEVTDTVYRELRQRLAQE